MFDVVIIGCGVTGAATAYYLSEYDIKSLYKERGYIDNKGNVYGTLHEIG